MYLRILRKDLKRNRVMNIILLVFVLLSAMFVSSSANNIITVMTAQDKFFEMSGMSDYYIMTKGIEREELDEVVNNLKHTSSCHTEQILFLSNDDVVFDGKKMEQATPLSMYSFEKSAMTYFSTEDQQIYSVENGTILLPNKIKNENDIKVGDTLNITLGSIKMDFVVAGFIKDALFGTTHVGMARCLISNEDFDSLYKDSKVRTELRGGALCSIETDDVEGVAAEFLTTGINSIMVADQKLLSTTYFLDMAVAGVLLVVSFCLVLIAIVVLRFTINFTLSQEFREIGVMKAMGISNRKIKGLYLVKYFALSMLGAILGFCAGIPFGDMMLKGVGQTMVMEESGNYFVNVLCVILVVAIVMLFCWGGTKKVDTLSPVAAVRDGSQGERFSKKSLISLAKSRMRTIPFLALNDIFSNIKRYVTMIIAFTLCLIVTIVVVNTINTLRSDKLLIYFATAESDVYLTNTSYVDYFEDEGRDHLKRDLIAMEKTLAEEGMNGHCMGEMMLFSTITAADRSYAGLVIQGTGTTADQYIYSEGTAPQNANEVAITPTVAEALDVTIGDTIVYNDMDNKREVIVTALFQSMLNMGNGIRLHEDAAINYTQASGINAYQIRFDDKPDAKELKRRMARLEELYPEYEVLTGDEYADYFTGSADMVMSVRNLLVPIMVAICAFIAMLMERSFIASEVGQIAMLLATGFTRRLIVRWHTLRMAIVLFISTVLGLLLSTPATQLLITPIFQMMGAESLKYDIEPFEAFVIYPGILIGFTLIAVFLTAQETRKITASQTSSIE